MTAFGRKTLSAVILTSALLLNQRKVGACSCIAESKTLCEYSDEATVVLHGLALSSTRADQEDINDSVSFTVQILQLHKEEDDVQYADELTFVTGGNSALCGVDLAIGQEYLIGLYPGLNGDQLFAQSCGLFRTWSSVTDEDKAELESCDYDQSCDLTCGDFQECLIYAEGTTAEEAFCADTCAAGTCGDEEVCSLESVLCIRAPCPALAVCTSQVGRCSNGLSGIEGMNDNGSACCPLECNQCGGSGCGSSGAAADLDGTDCCINGVLNTQQNCVFTWAAPCVVTTENGGGW